MISTVCCADRRRDPTPIHRERQLIEIAKALHREAELIIFDEPTTSLTPREIERLFEVINRLKAGGKTANDADGLAHLAEVGFFREVRVKGFDSMLTELAPFSTGHLGLNQEA